MALGISGSGGGGEDIRQYVKYDARSGKMFRVDRVQDSLGVWSSTPVEITSQATFVADIGNIKVGWLNFPQGAAPMMLLVSVGSSMPARPDGVDDKNRPLFKNGFSLDIALPASLGGGVWNLSSNAGCVVDALNQLHDEYLAAPESKQGLLPIVTLTGTKLSVVGKSSNYRPVFEIKGWSPRPASMAAKPQAAAPAPVIDNYAIARGVMPPATGSTQVAPPPPPPQHHPFDPAPGGVDRPTTLLTPDTVAAGDFG